MTTSTLHDSDLTTADDFRNTLFSFPAGGYFVTTTTINGDPFDIRVLGSDDLATRDGFTATTLGISGADLDAYLKPPFDSADIATFDMSVIWDDYADGACVLSDFVGSGTFVNGSDFTVRSRFTNKIGDPVVCVPTALDAVPA